MNASEQYRNEFTRAVELTRQLGSPTGRAWTGPPPRRYFSDRDQRLTRLFSRIAGRQALAWQCLEVSRQMLVAIMEEYGCDAHFTVGSIEIDGSRSFGVDPDDLAAMLATGMDPGSEVSMHAWITLDSFEIVDATLLSTMASANPDFASVDGGLFHGFPEELGAFRYRPVFVGVGLLKRIGLALDQPSQRD